MRSLNLHDRDIALVSYAVHRLFMPVPSDCRLSLALVALLPHSPSLRSPTRRAPELTLFMHHPSLQGLAIQAASNHNSRIDPFSISYPRPPHRQYMTLP